MQRLIAVLVAVLVAAVPVGAVSAGAPAVAAGAHDAVEPTYDRPDNGTANATNGSVAPGERLVAVVGVQAAEIDGAVEERTFGIRVARAATNDSKARVVADELSEVQRRIEELEQRKETLREQRANGSITEGRYQAEVAALSARAATLQRLTNASEQTARGLPADVLQRNGVNVSAIERLRENASKLTGPEVAAIARSIAGRDVGRSVAPSGPGPANVTAGPGNGTAGPNATGAPSVDQVRTGVETTERAVEETRETLNRTRETAGPAADDALDRAAENLTAAEEALADARSALDDGDAATADEHLADARDHLEAARAALDAARDPGNDGGY